MGERLQKDSGICPHELKCVGWRKQLEEDEMRSQAVFHKEILVESLETARKVTHTDRNVSLKRRPSRHF
jgi:hypothetical protein